jgi:hypothetical protein
MGVRGIRHRQILVLTAGRMPGMPARSYKVEPTVLCDTLPQKASPPAEKSRRV